MLLIWDEDHDTTEPEYEELENIIDDDIKNDDDEVVFPREIPHEDHLRLERQLVEHFTFIKRNGHLDWVR
jgi:hypothetical protein